MAMREPGAGELNRRVLIRRCHDLPYDYADLSTEYKNERKRWAKVEPVGTGVYISGVQTDTKITHRIIMRYTPDVGSDYEVVAGRSVYRVRRNAPLNGGTSFTVLEVEELCQNNHM